MSSSLLLSFLSLIKVRCKHYYYIIRGSGVVYGSIIGDMVGSPYEFAGIKTTDFDFINEKSLFTDDSVMTVAIAEALMNVPRK